MIVTHSNFPSVRDLIQWDFKSPWICIYLKTLWNIGTVCHWDFFLKTQDKFFCEKQWKQTLSLHLYMYTLHSNVSGRLWTFFVLYGMLFIIYILIRMKSNIRSSQKHRTFLDFETNQIIKAVSVFVRVFLYGSRIRI